MSKYLLRNAATASLSNVYLIRNGITGDWFERISGTNNINLVNAADILGVHYSGGGGGPEWGYWYTFTVDFDSGQSLSVKSENSTVTLTGYPATCTSDNNITGMFYVERSQNNPDLVYYSDNDNCYISRFRGRGSSDWDLEPGIIAQPEVVQIQKASTAITSVFPGVAYNSTATRLAGGGGSSNNPIVLYNPVNTKPYTVYIYNTDGTLLDTYVDCDVYYCSKTGYDYNYIYESSTSSSGEFYFTDALNNLYNTSGEGVTIQYSTSTTGDSWTDIGYYKPFPDNVKRVKIALITY